MSHTPAPWLEELLASLGFDPEATNRWLLLVVVIVVGIGLEYLMRLLLFRIVRPIVARTKITWDDVIFNDKVLRRICHLAPPIFFSALLPAIFPEHGLALTIVMRLLSATIVVCVTLLVNALLEAFFTLVNQRPAWHGKPLKGLLQTGEIIMWLIAFVLIVSVLFDQSPGVFLTGLGASAAIVMLIFRDTILGFVSGVQLSANNMLNVGDWITLPKYDADGEVEEVSLTTVKVRNFDKTITTIPPYLLVSDSFQNWEGMRASGGRRVKRSVLIDQTSIRFCTTEMLDRFSRIELIHDYIVGKQHEIEAYNLRRGIASPNDDAINGRRQTNIGVFRNYLNLFLRQHPEVNSSMTLLVRQMQPTEGGLPIELYFFADTVEWARYERIQSDVFDHVLAILPEFDLRVFQTPTGNDLRTLRDATCE